MTSVKIVHKDQDDVLATLVKDDLKEFMSTSLSADPVSDWRRHSFELARTLATPTNKDEDFKYFNFRRLDLSGLKPVDVISATNSNGRPASVVRAGLTSIASIPDHLKAADGSDEPPEGYFFGSLHDAVSQIDDKVECYLRFADSKFPQRKMVMLSHAYLSGGSFLYVPKRAELSIPRQMYTLISGEQTMTSYAAFAVLEELASTELVWDIEADADASGFFNGTLDLVAGAGSKTRLLLNQELNQHLDGVLTVRAHLGKDAELELVTLNIDGRVVQLELDVKMAAPGASAMVNGVYIGRARENFNFLTHQDHQIGDTRSDLYYAGTLAGKSSASYLGKITIAPNAQRSDAYQTDRNLVLNRGVKVNSSPKLEISANDVRCSHGATTSRVSEEEMFYLRSRGIARDDARILLADGFLEQVRGRISDGTLSEGFAVRLGRHLSSWRRHDS
jgi:Fe-S cluster assembly protein SufD